MTIVVTLLITSTVLGLATGLIIRVWVLAVVSVLIAIVSAAVLHRYDFGFAAGVPVVAGCLAISQIAYLAGLFIMSRSDNTESSTQKEIDNHPNNRGEHDVSDYDQ
jgi:uncharacterized membrane protein YkgB